MYFPVSGWFAAFVLTLAVEVPVATALLRPAERNLARLAILVGFANLATHPVAWFAISQVVAVDTPGYVIAAEAWAVAAEAVFFLVALRRVSPTRAISVALVANLSSYLAGRLVERLWPGLFG